MSALQVVLPGVTAIWQEGHQHGGRGPYGEEDGLARGEDVRGGLAVDDYAGEVCVDGDAGRGGRAGVGDLLTGVSEAADGGLGEDADDLLGWRLDANLTGANLYAASMGNADLTDAILTSTNLDFAYLYGANLSGVISGGITGAPEFLPVNWTLAPAVSGGDYLAGPDANLSNTSLVNLTNVDLAGADLAGSVRDGLTRANLTGADLTNATLPYLYESNLTNADLTDANLTDSNLDLSTITGAKFAGANLTGVSGWGTTGTPASLPSSWVIEYGCMIGPTANLTSCSLTNEDLSGLDMAGANLTSVLFLQGTNFTGANLSSAILTGANMSGDNLAKANLRSAQTTGAVFTDVTWDDTTCPNGTNSGTHVDGCFSPLIASPAARPAVTAGKTGTHGWYTSPVTVTWNWSDNYTIVTSKCTATSAATGSGKAITIAASCTNLAGITAHASVKLKIDQTRPKVTVTGVRNHRTYRKGNVPVAGCRTVETISGVATPAKRKVTTSGRNGLGRFTVTCSGAVSTAGTRQAQPQQITYTVIR